MSILFLACMAGENRLLMVQVGSWQPWTGLEGPGCARQEARSFGFSFLFSVSPFRLVGRMLRSYNSVSSSSACHALLYGQTRLRHGTRAMTGTKPEIHDDHRRLQKRLVCQATKGKFSSFDDMLGSYDTVLLDAYATWCGPCQVRIVLPVVAWASTFGSSTSQRGY